jgi:hypothetical protein
MPKLQHTIWHCNFGYIAYFFYQATFPIGEVTDIFRFSNQHFSNKSIFFSSIPLDYLDTSRCVSSISALECTSSSLAISFQAFLVLLLPHRIPAFSDKSFISCLSYISGCFWTHTPNNLIPLSFF